MRRQSQELRVRNQFVDSTLARAGGGLFDVTGMGISLIAETPLTDRGFVSFGLGSVIGGQTIEINKGHVLDLSTGSIFENISFFKVVDATLGTPRNRRLQGKPAFRQHDVTEVVPVPLPAAGVVLVAGIGGLAVVRRRKRA